MRHLPATIVLALSVALGTGHSLVAKDVAPLAAQNSQNSRLRGFVITLVLGDIQGQSSDSFTPAEQKALLDLKGFLPYKSYRPLDTAWVIGLSTPHLFLRSEDGQKHEFYMRGTQISPSHVAVEMLRLWDVQPADPHIGPAVLIDTSFKIDVDETVVVGTSRLDGGRALILLVTAAPREASVGADRPGDSQPVSQSPVAGTWALVFQNMPETRWTLTLTVNGAQVAGTLNGKGTFHAVRGTFIGGVLTFAIAEPAQRFVGRFTSTGALAGTATDPIHQLNWTADRVPQ